MGCADYWDSYWIIQGLLKSELYDIANSTLQNFMDEINTFGFIPNGGRIYCELTAPLYMRALSHESADLDRSQPPLFTRVSVFDCISQCQN